MRYLMDTHALLWAIFEPEKMSKSARALIKDPQNEVFASIISFWEISLKFSIGKLELINTTPESLPKIAEEMGVEILPVEANEAASFHKLPRKRHKDPFDRMVAWQAISRKMTLISRDQEFKQYKQFGLRLVW
jgi:PIN domain nuclease of toxin-antitoxin system